MPSNHSRIQWSDTPAEEALCDRIRTLEALRDDLYRNYDAVVVQRDELLAALEVCKPHVDVSTGAGTLALIQACAAICKAKGE